MLILFWFSTNDFVWITNILLAESDASDAKEPSPLKTSEAPKNLPRGRKVLNLVIFYSPICDYYKFHPIFFYQFFHLLPLGSSLLV